MSFFFSKRSGSICDLWPSSFIGFHRCGFSQLATQGVAILLCKLAVCGITQTKTDYVQTRNAYFKVAVCTFPTSLETYYCIFMLYYSTKNTT